MRTVKSYRVRNTALVVLLFLSCGIFIHFYLKNHTIAGYDLYGVFRRTAATPVFSFLPGLFFTGEAESISQERNATVLESVFAVFDPSLETFLASVPIMVDSSAKTAKAYRTKGYIGVSPDWDKTVRQSRYRKIYEQRGMKPDDPVFSQRFKTDLLIHEFLHILQSHLGIDSRSFYDTVAQWYRNPRYGMPSSRGIVSADAKNGRPDELAINRIKYILWHELYNYRRVSNVLPDESWKNMQYGGRYWLSEKGVEEFAYIGQEILSTGSSSENYIKTGQWCDEDWKDKKMKLLEISPEVIALYRGVFNPVLIR
jgi:hypothetical protein